MFRTIHWFSASGSYSQKPTIGAFGRMAWFAEPAEGMEDDISVT